MIPLLVFISLRFTHQMPLFFSLFAVAVLTASVMLAAIIAQNGESNWLEERNCWRSI